MQQRFNTRNYSVRDFEEWKAKGELELAPKFQRRSVWSDKARSYLMDTVIRGKPIPKIYMRQDTNPKTRRTIREVVDGQQRLKTVLIFLDDAFKISKTHNEEYGGKYFSELDIGTQKDILKYEFAVDLLEDMPDQEIYDVFARLNTYAATLNPQELRHARFFGEFRSSVYLLANEFNTFWQANDIFSPKKILRMAEAELVSELLIAIIDGIHAGEKRVITSFYEKYDDTYALRKANEKKFRHTIDTIGRIFGGDLAQSEFRATRLFYPLFCATYHQLFGLPKLAIGRKSLKTADHPKLKVGLQRVDTLIQNVEETKKAPETTMLSVEERKFIDAYSEHWVHADRRTTMTEYLCRQMSLTI